ncbi:MAG: hypothetical protein WCF65_00895 [Parachlamydiaceae bacterium]
MRGQNRMSKGIFIRYVPVLLVMLACCLLSGCGYQLGQGCEGLSSRYSTMSVPYVIGDQNGSLTSAIIREVVQSGSFEYRTFGGGLVLNVKRIDITEDNIGFRYDRKKSGKLTKDTIPTEARISMVVEFSIVEATSGCTVLGPICLSAAVEYDHDYYSSRDGVNTFSLGQLSDLEEAYDAVQTPLNQVMAQKIIDYISQSW